MVRSLHDTRVMYRLAWIGFIILTTACSDEQAPAHFTANLGCTASDVLEHIQPGGGVSFVNDTNRILPAWRAAVGPPLVDRAGRSCEAAPLDSLMVVSWNVHVGGAEIRRFVSDLRGGRIVQGVPVRHFVLLLQEAYRKGDAVPAKASPNACPDRQNGEGPDVQALSDSLALALYYVPSMRNGCGVRQDRGNAILSTLPLSNLKAIELPVVRQRRVAAVANVKGHTSAGVEWTLSVASIHLENRGPGNMRDWAHGRAVQARALVAALPETPLAVVGGDFNTLQGPGEPAVKIMKAKFANTPTAPKGITYVSYGVVRSHLDYLFFRAAGNRRAHYWRAASRYGSDHYPVMGFVRLTP